MSNGWCAACQVGYVAGAAIKSADLFDAIDAHGHEFKPETVECESCQAAIARNGFCDACGLGFANGQLYCSCVSYALGRGRSRDTASIECARCRENSEHYGWCIECKVGMTGNVEFADEALFEEAVRQYRLLQVAIGRAEVCEWCGVVTITRGECPVHPRRNSGEGAAR